MTFTIAIVIELAIASAMLYGPDFGKTIEFLGDRLIPGFYDLKPWIYFYQY